MKSTLWNIWESFILVNRVGGWGTYNNVGPSTVNATVHSYLTCHNNIDNIFGCEDVNILTIFEQLTKMSIAEEGISDYCKKMRMNKSYYFFIEILATIMSLSISPIDIYVRFLLFHFWILLMFHGFWISDSRSSYCIWRESLQCKSDSKLILNFEK